MVVDLKEADESKHFPFLRSRLVSTSHGNFPLVTSFFEDSGRMMLSGPEKSKVIESPQHDEKRRLCKNPKKALLYQS